MSSSTRSDTSLRPLTRWVSAAVIPFLVAASFLLYLLPGETEALFAWTIEPPLTAMLLGSAYLGGIWFFVQVLRSRSWSAVRYGFPAVVIFATLLAVATVLHWDRFHHGHVSFITWAVIYAAAPVFVLVALIRNWNGDRADAGSGVLVPLPLRGLLVPLGGASLLVGLALFFAPAAFLDVWAWPITPLTGRVIGAVLTLPGAVNLWLLVDPRWSAYRLIVQAELVSLGFMLIALVLAGSAIVWSRPAAALFTAAIAASAAVFLAAYLWCDRQSRRPTG